MDALKCPPLPERVIFDGGVQTQPQPVPSEETISRLRQGCYFARWVPRQQHPFLFHHFNGVIRVEKDRTGVTASGDLYYHPAFIFYPRFRVNPDPNPRAGIPVFSRGSYCYYIRVGHVFFKSGNRVDIVFERYSLRDAKTSAWDRDGVFTAQLTFMQAPSNYLRGATYLKGDIRSGWDPGSPGSGPVVGTLSMGWVSSYLRKAKLEVDRVRFSEYPANNLSDVDWRDVYKPMDWDVRVFESNSNVTELHGEAWSLSELHAAMLDWRDSHDVDREWRYYLLCVRKVISDSYFGFMFDWQGSDSNEIPREGAAVASHVKFPRTPNNRWGPLTGKRLGTTSIYFRTAVHEIGHAMGLLHNLDGNGFMNFAYRVADASGGTFPENVEWSFHAEDEHRLRHLPDPWVRPGMTPWGLDYRRAPISIQDRQDLSDVLELEVRPLLSSVPLGAPVRVRISLRNNGDAPIVVPNSLSFKNGHVSGCVEGAGWSKGFRSVLQCLGEETRELGLEEEICHDLTLLRGREGALFAVAGVCDVKVDVMWMMNDMPVIVRGSGAVIVTPAVTESHANAALKTLSTPDLLPTMVFGGDHLKEGVEALKVALKDETLGPHYAVVEAKRLCQRFRDREPDALAALKMLSEKTVMSATEVKRVAGLVGAAVKKAPSALERLKKCAVGDKEAEDIVSKLGRV